MPFPLSEPMTLSLVSRSSNLARAQVREAQKLINYFYPQITFDPTFLESQGDKDKTTSLRELEKTNFFTDTLDQLLLEEKVRLALHSAKDLPEPLAPGLVIAALTPCIDTRDALVLAKHITFEQDKPFTQSLRVATSSKRREEAVLEIAPNAVFSDLRGTIEERLLTLEKGMADAVVIAEAALIRLGLTHLPRVFLPGKTAGGQGSLAIVIREDDSQMRELFSVLDTRCNRPLSIYLGIDPESYQQKVPFRLVHLPIIETHNFLSENQALDSQVKEAYLKATHVMLTSPRAASYLVEWIKSTFTLPQAEQLMSEKMWWCMGMATASLLPQSAIKQRICENESTAEAMLPWIQELEKTASKNNCFIFFPHSLRSRSVLKEELEKSQIPHQALAIYQTQSKKIDHMQLIQQADELIFTSPSCVESFYSQISILPKARFKSIGAITQLALQKYNHHRYTASTAL